MKLGRPQWGRWAPPPWDRRLAPGACRRGGSRGQRRCPARGPAPDRRRRTLTSTMANRSSSSPGSGIGSFKGTLCALKSVCCESMLPALPMLAARRGQGLLRAPRVHVRNQNSSRRPAPTRWGDLPGSPLSAAPRRLCSAHRSLAALRAEPPPGLPHAPRRPRAAPIFFPLEGSSGRRAPICMLLRWDPLFLPAIPDSGCVAPLTRSPTWASATADTSSPSAAEHNARSASTSSRQMLLRAPDTMPPLARPPLKAWLRPFAPRTAGTSSFCPKCPHAETTPALEGPAGLGPPAAKAICTPLETAFVTFDPFHSNSRDNHCVYIDSDT